MSEHQRQESAGTADEFQSAVRELLRIQVAAAGGYIERDPEILPAVVFRPEWPDA